MFNRQHRTALHHTSLIARGEGGQEVEGCPSWDQGGPEEMRSQRMGERSESGEVVRDLTALPDWKSDLICSCD